MIRNKTIPNNAKTKMLLCRNIDWNLYNSTLVSGIVYFWRITKGFLNSQKSVLIRFQRKLIVAAKCLYERDRKRRRTWLVRKLALILNKPSCVLRILGTIWCKQIQGYIKDTAQNQAQFWLLQWKHRVITYLTLINILAAHRCDHRLARHRQLVNNKKPQTLLESVLIWNGRKWVLLEP